MTSMLRLASSRLTRQWRDLVMLVLVAGKHAAMFDNHIHNPARSSVAILDTQALPLTFETFAFFVDLLAITRFCCSSRFRRSSSSNAFRLCSSD